MKARVTAIGDTLVYKVGPYAYYMKDAGVFDIRDLAETAPFRTGGESEEEHRSLLLLVACRKESLTEQIRGLGGS